MKVRPITVMAALAAMVAVAAVAFAWRAPSGARVEQPASLPLALDSAATASTMAPAIARLDNVTYVRGPGVDDLAGTQTAWVLRAGLPDRSVVARLAGALGVTGSVAERDGQLVVGDPSGRSLQVSGGGGSTWTFSDGTHGGAGVAICAQTNAVPPPTTVPPDSGPLLRTPDTTCPEPSPPVGLPDGPTAEAAARRLLGDAGIDLAHTTVTVTADGYATVVQFSRTLDGTSVADLDTRVEFGAEAAVVAANGWLAVPTRGDQYPLIGVDAALARLSRGEGEVGIRPMMAVPQVDQPIVDQPAVGAPLAGSGGGTSTSGTLVVPPTTGTVPMPPTTSTTVEVVPPPGRPVPMPPTTPTVPMPTVPPPSIPQPRDVTVTVTQATLVLAAVPGTDGSTWLVPAYHLEAASGGSWTVLAIDPSYIAPPPVGPPDTTGSSGGSTTPGSTGSSGGSSTPGSGSTTPDSGEPTPPPTVVDGPPATCVPSCPDTWSPGVDVCCRAASTTTTAG